MTRKSGSGLHRGVSKAIEQLTADLFAGRPTAESLNKIHAQQSAGRSGVAPDSVHRWLSEVVDRSALPVVDAELPATDYLGDVQLTLRDGSHVFIEVKAQTTKNFVDLIQADWIKDVTDTLRWLYAEDETFRALQPPWLAELLDERAPQRYFGSWTFKELWAADVALLTDRNRRSIAGVEPPQQLWAFLSRKYLLQVSSEGARMVRLDRIPLISRIIDGHGIRWDIKSLKKSTSVRVSAGSGDRRDLGFVYYVGYGPEVVGRHKLTVQALDGAAGAIEVS